MLLINLFNVIYVLIAIAMLVLILLQRGAGAQAGSGFGSGASATVFGARGATTFLSRSTAVLAALFFTLSLIMGVYMHPTGPSGSDLGVMSGAADAPKAPAPAADPAGNSDVPKASTPAATPAPSATPPAEAAPKKDDAGGPKPEAPKPDAPKKN
jgi:preprotein translocase subunit SecG